MEGGAVGDEQPSNASDDDKDENEVSDGKCFNVALLKMDSFYGGGMLNFSRLTSLMLPLGGNAPYDPDNSHYHQFDGDAKFSHTHVHPDEGSMFYILPDIGEVSIYTDGRDEIVNVKVMEGADREKYGGSGDVMHNVPVMEDVFEDVMFKDIKSSVDGEQVPVMYNAGVPAHVPSMDNAWTCS